MARKHEGPRYKKLYPMFWRDPDVRRLDDSEKVVALYCITSHQTNRIGLFVLSPAMASEDLGVTVATFLKRLATVCETLHWGWDESSRVLFIPSWWKWNAPENENVMIGNLKDLLELPETVLLKRFASNTAHVPDYALKTFSETLAKHCANHAETVPQTVSEPYRNQEQYQEQEHKQEQEQDRVPNGTLSKSGEPTLDRGADVLYVFAHYRKHRPKRFLKPTAKLSEWKKIRARLDEGFTVESLCQAIDGNMRSAWHQGENDRQRVYDSLELIVRDSKHVHDFIDVPVRSATAAKGKPGIDLSWMDADPFGPSSEEPPQ